MKRAASFPLVSPPRRAMPTQQQQQQHDDDRQTRTATALFEALPIILTSGYLYSFECMQAAPTCKNWTRVWNEVGRHLPENSKVKVFLSIGGRPNFIKRNGLEDVLQSPQFARQVYDKVSKLNSIIVPSHFVWGSEIRFVDVFCWDYQGGVKIEYSKTLRRGTSALHRIVPAKVHLEVELDKKLRLRGVVLPDCQDAYDGTPFWP